MQQGPVRYRSPDEDSARWLEIDARAGDIVISTRSKSGTTWMQMICLLLVLRTPELPAPLGELSPWVDALATPVDALRTRLDEQRHRRVLKTHTPLDGLPLHRRATYVVVGRHPLDAAVSLYHQGHNLDHERLRALTGAPEPPGPPAPPRPVRQWLLDWVGAQARPRQELDSLPGVLWHLGDAWARRGEPNVVLVHYDDLVADLAGQMRRLAERLDLAVPEALWPTLVEAARFEAMRCRAAVLVPDTNGVLKDPNAFFRRGRSGAGRELLTPRELERYHARASGLAGPELLAWLHGDRPAPS